MEPACELYSPFKPKAVATPGSFAILNFTPTCPARVVCVAVFFPPCVGCPGGSAWRVGQGAEWLMAADCKAATACELGRTESSPVHPKFLAEFSTEPPAYAPVGGLPL